MTPLNQASPQLLAKPAAELLEEFGAGHATPGSGSAAALMGLLAGKLLITVCKKSIEKIPNIQEKKHFEFIQNKLEVEVCPTLARLLENDARDFGRVIALRRKHRASTKTAEKTALKKEEKDRLEISTRGVFDICNISLGMIEHGIVLFNSGWPVIRGDTGTAISASIAAVYSGIYIINLNLKDLKPRKFVPDAFTKCREIQNRLVLKEKRALECVASLTEETSEKIQLKFPLLKETPNQPDT